MRSMSIQHGRHVYSGFARAYRLIEPTLQKICFTEETISSDYILSIQTISPCHCHSSEFETKFFLTGFSNTYCHFSE